jgi:hypothetical protein
LKPSELCQKATAKANALLSKIQRTFHYRDRHTNVKLRAICAAAFGLCGACMVVVDMCGQSVSRKSAGAPVKAASGLRRKKYHKKLLLPNLPSLEYRRVEVDMALTQKILSDSD